jgi:hypothetical protein
MHIQYTVYVYIDIKQTDSREKSVSWEAKLMGIHSKNCGFITSKEFIAGPYPKPDESSPRPQILFI